MKEDVFRFLGVILLIAFVIHSPAYAGAQAAFRGRLFTSGAIKQVINVRFDIKSYSTEDELLQLQQHLSLNDLDGFYSAFRSMNKGAIRFLGTTGLNIKINAAQEKPTGQGVRIFLVTETRSIEPGSLRARIVSFRFLVVVLDLDKDHKGEATIYEDALVKFTRQGIELESSYSTSKKIFNLQLVK